MSDGRFDLDGRQTHFALGKGGVKTAADKHEGDGATPLGTWTLRRILYRPDRGPPPLTALPAQAIGPDDGWCDAPADPAYNTPVRLPYPASAEHLWREDHVYDLIGILAYNDDPPVPGKGSAIFLHIARDGYTPTEGCVALAREDLLVMLKMARPGDAVAIVQA
jgi:L,D-peptidoglycan transpeptidase YkuD (ErfK/YbiS/YcfS/YnhG family)